MRFLSCPSLAVLLTFMLCVLPPLERFIHAAEADNEPLVYVGTYAPGESKGIYLFRLQTTGLEVSQNITLVPLGVVAQTPSASFIEIDPKRRLLFAVNEVEAGMVSSFSIAADGKLKPINQKSSKGSGPCHLVLDKTGRNLLVANYGSGSVAVLAVSEDGTLGDATSVIQHQGKGTNPDRQTAPHAHCVTLSPDNRFAFVCDLGIDKVMIYQFDAEKGTLTPGQTPFVATKPGAGPRHMTFRPDGKFAYVINELDSTITAFAYDAQTGALKELETVTTLPGYYDGPNTAAEIAVHPSGQFLYASNRGNESVVLFTIDPDKGTLTWVEEQNTGGKEPRHFSIASTGKHMVICNQATGTLLASRIDKDNGRLKPSGVFAKAPLPACAVFLVPPGAATTTEAE